MHSSTSKKELKEIAEYKGSISFEERFTLQQNLKAKFPGRIPVVFLKSKTSTTIQLEKNKMIFQPDWKLGQVVGVLHEKLRKSKDSKTTEQSGIFLTLSGNISAKLSTRLDTLYECYSDEDGFLYLIYSEENTTGSD